MFNKSFLTISVPKSRLIDLRVKLQSGNISIFDLQGKALIKMYAGNIKMENFDGDLSFKLYAGNLVYSNGTLNSIYAKAYAGNMEIKANCDLQEDSFIKHYAGQVDFELLEYRGEGKIHVSSFGGDFLVKGEHKDDAFVFDHKLRVGKPAEDIRKKKFDFGWNYLRNGEDKEKSAGFKYKLEMGEDFKDKWERIFGFDLFKKINELGEKIKTGLQKNGEMDINVDNKENEVNRVLDLLENGKITAKEASELLKAMKR